MPSSVSTTLLLAGIAMAILGWATPVAVVVAIAVLIEALIFYRAGAS